MTYRDVTSAVAIRQPKSEAIVVADLNAWELIEYRRELVLAEGEYGPQPSQQLASEDRAFSEGLFTCSIGQSCGNEKTEVDEEGIHQFHTVIEARARRCRSGACGKCGPCKAGKLAKRLMPALAKMKFPRMYTLTLIPGQWAKGPRQAFEHVKDKRLVASWVKELNRRGYLNVKHFFCAEETQNGERKEDGTPPTEMIHFHVLIDVKDGYLPHSEAQAIWNSYRPADAVVLGDWRDESFGRVHYKEVDGPEGIAKYVCKYVAKGPKLGLPKWIEDRLDEGHNLIGYTKSVGFWQWAGEPPKPKPPQDPTAKPRVRKQWRKRLAGCGRGVDLYLVTRKKSIGVEGWNGKAKAKFLGPLDCTFQQLAEHARASEEDLKKGVVVVSTTLIDQLKVPPVGLCRLMSIRVQEQQKYLPLNLAELRQREGVGGSRKAAHDATRSREPFD